MYPMRHLLFATLVVSFIAAGCNSGAKKDKVASTALADTARYTTIEWLDSARDFGKIPEGQKLDVAFRFRNTGTTPLVIGQVRPSCGCTIAEQPQEPIAPGSEGQIKAVFNSEGRSGVNHKTLFVTANTKDRQEYSLHFEVQVERKGS
jgi:predicted small secreted protein